MGRYFFKIVIFFCLFLTLSSFQSFADDSVFLNPEWEVGQKWTICRWANSGLLSFEEKINIRGGKILIDFCVEKKVKKDGHLCWQIYCREKESPQDGLIFACRYWFKCNDYKLIKVANCNYPYKKNNVKNSYFGRELRINYYPSNASYTLPLPEPALFQKNIFDLKSGSGSNQLSTFDTLTNSWKIIILPTNDYIDRPKNVDTLSNKQKEKYLDFNSKYEFIWKNGEPWWSSCKVYVGTEVQSITELVTPEWEKKHGKVQK